MTKARKSRALAPTKVFNKGDRVEFCRRIGAETVPSRRGKNKPPATWEKGIYIEPVLTMRSYHRVQPDNPQIGDGLWIVIPKRMIREEEKS